MSSRSQKQMPDHTTKPLRSPDLQSSEPESKPASPDVTSGSRASPEGSATGVGSRKLSSGQVTVLVATIGAAATITTAALNGMFGLVSSHSTPTPTPPPTSASSSVPATASAKPSASSSHLAAGPLVAGDNSAFVSDVTYPDGSKVVAGQRIIKKWEIKNTGSVTWTGRYLVADGESTGACTYPSRVPVPTTDPGHTAIISVSVMAASTPQVCYVTWKMANGAGNLYFPNEIGIWFNVRIIASPRQ
jgi:Ig-like domain from next to BRCA1 gene